MGIHRPEGRGFHGDECGWGESIRLHSDGEEVKPTHFFVSGLHYKGVCCPAEEGAAREGVRRAQL